MLVQCSTIDDELLALFVAHGGELLPQGCYLRIDDAAYEEAMAERASIAATRSMEPDPDRKHDAKRNGDLDQPPWD